MLTLKVKILKHTHINVRTHQLIHTFRCLQNGRDTPGTVGGVGI